MKLDLTFAQNYTVNTDAWLPSSPGSMPLYYYPGASTAGGHDGILLEIAPDDGMPWLGMFANGTYGSLSGIYSCPNGRSICVISLGRWYFVEAGNPLKWREKTESISDVRILPGHNMLILCERNSLIAYGAHGFLWKTEGISLCGLTIEAIEGNILHGKAPKNYRNDNAWVDYEVNLVTGKQKGA